MTPDQTQQSYDRAAVRHDRRIDTDIESDVEIDAQLEFERDRADYLREVQMER